MGISKRSIILVLVVIGSLFVFAACGGSDSDSVVVSDSGSSSSGSSIVSSDPELESEAVGDDVATPVPERKPPPAVSVVPLDVPEEGSEEAAVLAALDRYVTSINTQDWPEFQAQCSTGNSRNVVDVDKIKFTFEEYGGFFKFDIPDFSIYGFNGRAVEFRIYSQENARATFDLYDYDKWLATGVSRTFEKVDGVWMSDSYECYPG
jgi:hypothetical protein